MTFNSCAICQPHYFPWLGYFEMIDRVDTFIFLDDVQLVMREWKTRNKIRNQAKSNETQWLTIPIMAQCHRSFINEAKISEDHSWINKHLRSIEHVYSKSPFFAIIMPKLQLFLKKERWENLAQLNISLISDICLYIGINTKTIISSDLNIGGKREEKLRNICHQIGADSYLANNATGDYVPPNFFESKGITFLTQDYNHPEYTQQSGNHLLPFLSHLSIIDLLMNHGRSCLEIIRTKSHKGESF